ncbi:MAG TPA: zinc ribbon domain-containing protein [Ktedonobacterales bacterium]|nr:zinc ribbon domain-containing protein [Ktedonobacterales bacterium]
MSERPDVQGGLCPVCGSPLTEGAQFCGACGCHVPSPHHPYDAPTTPEGLPSDAVSPTVPGIPGLSIETGVRCMSCGTANILDADQCVACGASLADEPTELQWHSEPGRNGHQP